MVYIYKNTKYRIMEEYIVTLENVDAQLVKYSFKTLDELDEFVVKANAETYWFVSKIEKIKRYEFMYDKLVIQKPLFYTHDEHTEMDTIGNDKQQYSFIKIDASLSNVKREHRPYYEPDTVVEQLIEDVEENDDMLEHLDLDDDDDEDGAIDELGSNAI